jgi:hypothetical protein
VYLYFIPFKGRTWKDANQVQRFAEEGLETGVEVQPSEMATFYTLYGTPTISVAQNTGNTIFFTARDNYCRWTKKLDEIAWYSKADYPFINGDWDPQEPFIRDNPFWKKNSTSYTFPASYRRMKFGYNYELAKGTPNSRSNGYEIGSLGYPIKRPNSGRLSLKEIHEQAGQEAAGKSVDMPSYLFAYQDKDSLYGKNLNDQDTAFRRVDVWGYRTEDRLALHSNSTYDDQSKVGTKGVHWNLSSITLPSCGTINVSYERDRARSSWLTLAEMNREYEAIKKAEDRDKIKEGLYYPALKAFGADNSNYTTDVEVNNLFPNTPVITSVAGSSCEGLEPGMLAILVYEGSKTTGSTIRNMTQATYLYRICKINYSHASAEITLDKPLEPPPTELTGTGATYSIKLRGIKKKSDICDGIRVTKIQTNSISGVTTTAYRYPIDGVIESAPADAIPPFLTQNWNKLFTYTETSSFTGVASAAVFMYSPASNIPMPKITLRTGFYPKGPAEAEIYHSAMNAYIFGETQNFNIAGQEVRFIIPRSQTSDFGCELHILYSYEGDDITGPAKRDISVAGKFNGAELVKTYSNVEFPITPGFAKAQFVGDVVIPISEKFMTSNLNIGRDYWHNVSIKFSANSTGDLKIYGILKRVVSSNKKAIAYAPIFTSGNTGVIYPVVEVQQTKPDGTLFTGKTRYSYFTIDDTVPANGTSVPIVSSSIIKTSEGVPVWRVFDRTGIVGLAKTIEQVQVNNAGTETVVGKTEKQYAFSEDMYKSDVGVLSAADTRLDNTKPIGLIRERAIGIELKNTDDAKNLTKPPSAISDIVRSKPFLVSIQEQTDRASKGTKFGLFDALTGNALATLVTGASPTGTVTRLNVTVPYRFILSKYVSSQKELLDTMMNKNILTLPGGNYVSDNNALTTMPDNIAASASDEAQHIKSADFTQYLLRPYKGSNIPFAQARIEQQSKYSWKMNPTVGGFGWLLNSDSTIKGCWIANSYIDSIDLYSRPLQERTPGNAPGVFQVSTAINHPTAPAVLAVVANAAYDECAVFTCDYDQNIGNTPVGSNTFVRTCFDDVNGWMANQNSGELKVIPLSRTGTPNRHFGNKALHFSNGAAVSKTLDRNAGYTKDFMVSAWVYPEDTDNEFKVTFSLSAKTGSTNSASPVTFSRKITDLKKDVWQQVRFFICREELAFSAPLSLQISVSASIGSFYMDDIRFHPANALMSTFYYDYSFNKPVAMVDANSHAQYFRYDEFGRLVEKGVIKDRKPNGKQSIAATVTAVQDVNNPKTWVLTAAVSQGSMQSVVWDFGDGSRKLSSDLEVNKTYVATGTGTHAYSVTVYVIGQDAVATAKTNVSFTIP